jgi:hypothetical protein
MQHMQSVSLVVRWLPMLGLLACNAASRGSEGAALVGGPPAGGVGGALEPMLPVAGAEAVANAGQGAPQPAFVAGGAAGAVGAAGSAGVSGADGPTVRVEPEEYTLALRNPLKGPGTSRGPDWDASPDHPLATLHKYYVAWNEIEGTQADGIDRIREYSDAAWAEYPDQNAKVVPRLWVEWDEGDFSGWPSDLPAGAYEDPAFVTRLERLIRRLGEAWNEDPRVGFIEHGVWGAYGEQANGKYQPPAELAARIAEVFKEAFPNKKIIAPNPWTWNGMADTHGLGTYWDTYTCIGESRARTSVSDWVQGAEIAYNYCPQVGANANATMSDPAAWNVVLETNRTFGTTYIFWLGTYGLSEQTRVGANEVTKGTGYRFLLHAVEYSGALSPTRELSVAFETSNVGVAPFYYPWQVELSLLDPITRAVVWAAPFPGVDIRTWQPGAARATHAHVFAVPASVPYGEYILALAILDPGGGLPSLRFAAKNYFQGGRHPIGRVGVNANVAEPRLDPSSFDDPQTDRTLRYSVAP